MSAIRENAQRFFDACESGQGWAVCRQYCHEDATFSAQADALGGIDTVEKYTEWAKGLLTPMPDAGYEIQAFAVDADRDQALIFSVFRGTHTGPGGPMEPTGKSLAAEYVYALRFDGGKIRHMTKIWNDGHSLKQVGWA